MTASTETTLFRNVMIAYGRLLSDERGDMVDAKAFETVTGYVRTALENASGNSDYFEAEFLGELDWFSRFTTGEARAWFSRALPYVKGMDDPADGKW